MTNSEIAKSESLWDEYFNTEAHAENVFDSMSYDERIALLNEAYPED